MNFLKKIFKSHSGRIKTYDEFWSWFQKHKQVFFDVVKSGNDIEKKFLNKLSPKLEELKDGYFYLTGMYDDNTVELVLTADGNTSNIVFVEELVASAPPIAGWKFTALKPAIDIKDVGIELGDHTFNAGNMTFYSNELPAYPDEIDITIVHNDFTEENKKDIINGTYIYLDNYLGELDFLNNIDSLTVLGPKEAKSELIPLEKLKDFLNWRKKEFIEKYEDTIYNGSNDNFSVMEGKLPDGNPLLAVINTGLLKWDSKASHPWLAVITFKYTSKDNNGMPDKEDYQLLDRIQEEILQDLKDQDGYLNIGRQTAGNERELYFAGKDFRLPSKVFYNIVHKYSEHFEIEYEIYKDKYWQSFEKFAD